MFAIMCDKLNDGKVTTHEVLRFDAETLRLMLKYSGGSIKIGSMIGDFELRITEIGNMEPRIEPVITIHPGEIRECG